MKWKAARLWIKTAWPKAKPVLYRILRVYVFFLTTLSFALFIMEEALQSCGFGIFMLSAIKYQNDETLEAWENQVNALEMMNECADEFRWWVWPFTWPVNHAFMHYFEATRMYVQQNRVRLASEREKKEWMKNQKKGGDDK